MQNPRLESERDNTAPKCANCGWFEGGTMPAGRCGRHEMKVLDLSKCTDWRDGEPVQEIMSGDE